MNTTPPIDRDTVHASCVVVGEAGVLVRGIAGSGKSRLCLALLEQAYREGDHASLVGDDRIVLGTHHGRLVAHGHPLLSGVIEIRGSGLHRLAHHAPAAVVRLVVDLVDNQPRMPHVPGTVTILGVQVPGLVLEPREPREYLVRVTLASQCGGVASRSHPWAQSSRASGLM